MDNLNLVDCLCWLLLKSHKSLKAQRFLLISYLVVKDLVCLNLSDSLTTSRTPRLEGSHRLWTGIIAASKSNVKSFFGKIAKNLKNFYFFSFPPDFFLYNGVRLRHIHYPFILLFLKYNNDDSGLNCVQQGIDNMSWKEIEESDLVLKPSKRLQWSCGT